jgi:hypothetical protein
MTVTEQAATTETSAEKSAETTATAAVQPNKTVTITETAQSFEISDDIGIESSEQPTAEEAAETTTTTADENFTDSGNSLPDDGLNWSPLVPVN